MDYREIIDNAIKLMETDNSYNLFDAIVDVVDKDKGFDFKAFAIWVRKNKPLLSCLETDIIEKKLYRETVKKDKIINSKSESINIDELFGNISGKNI